MKNPRPSLRLAGLVNGQEQQPDPNTNPSTPQSPLEQLVTLHDVADALQCTVRWLQQQRAAGKFPRPDFERGKVIRWLPETIRRWISEGGAK